MSHFNRYWLVPTYCITANWITVFKKTRNFMIRGEVLHLFNGLYLDVRENETPPSITYGRSRFDILRMSFHIYTIVSCMFRNWSIWVNRIMRISKRDRPYVIDGGVSFSRTSKYNPLNKCILCNLEKKTNNNSTTYMYRHYNPSPLNKIDKFNVEKNLHTLNELCFFRIHQF
jgi:hypothetical protein